MNFKKRINVAIMHCNNFVKNKNKKNLNDFILKIYCVLAIPCLKCALIEVLNIHIVMYHTCLKIKNINKLEN